MRLSIPPLLLALPFLPACATAAGGRLAVRTDNDFWVQGGDSDRDYTQGVRFEWLEPPASQRSLPRSVLEPLGFLDLARLDRPSDGAAVRVEETSWFLEQRIYTPRDFDEPQPMPDDRPFVGWLRAGVARTVARFDRDPARRRDRTSRLELSLGSTGPPSLGEQAQTLTHALLGGNEPRGWDNQVGWEPTLQLGLDHRRRDFHQSFGDAAELDVVWGGGFELGNFWTYLDAAATARAGFNLPRELAPVEGDDRDPFGVGWRAPRSSFLGYVTVGGRLVFRDLSIEGGTWQDRTDLHTEFPVGVAEAGLAWRFRGFWMGYAAVAQTREYQEQEERHLYGQIRLGYAWAP